LRPPSSVFLHTDKLYFDTVQFYPPSADAEWLPQNTNAVLWTIRLEILSYAFVALLMSISLLKPGRQAMTVVIVVVLAALSVAYLPNVKVKWISQLMFVLPSLCCGIFMNWLVRFHRPRADIAFISAVGLALAALYGVLPSVFCFLVAYPLIWMGSVSFSPFRWFSSETDLSYGIYLYGWPVTQLIRAAVGDGLSGYELTALALPATGLVAYLSWHLIEKPALAFKAAKAEIVPT
jgi:peptidoglycan/LPS O-acetylase OafA/YrhL